MDTLTHIVLGACIGEIVAGKRLGKPALLVGALANSLPDIDFVASFWMPTTDDLLAHRGFTHSFMFLALAAPLLAWVSGRVFARAAMNYRQWLWFWALQVFVHLFIDAFNAYGTAWFEPFSHYRVSFNTMFVADPLFTLWPLAAFAVLMVRKREWQGRVKLAAGALSLSAVYLVMGIVFKLYVANAAETAMKAKGIPTNHYFTTPTPLNNLLWYVVAGTDSGYYIGYRSVLDKAAGIDFHFAPRNDYLLRLTTNKHDADNLVRFADGFYTVGRIHDSLALNVLRFGERFGWSAPQPGFVFYYFLDYPDANKLIVQRGRVAGWNADSVQHFVRRIGGR